MNTYKFNMELLELQSVVREIKVKNCFQAEEHIWAGRRIDHKAP